MYATDEFWEHGRLSVQSLYQVWSTTKQQKHGKSVAVRSSSLCIEGETGRMGGLFDLES